MSAGLDFKMICLVIFLFLYPEITRQPRHLLQYLHLCEIIDAIPEKKLSHTWRYDGYPGNTMVTFELTEQDGKTLLRLSHQGIETFPEDNEDLSIGNFIAGWNSIIHVSLRNYLETPQ